MSLTETSINNMDIDNINKLLNGGKYIPKIKKDKLLERKNLLEGKSKKHIAKHFCYHARKSFEHSFPNM